MFSEVNQACCKSKVFQGNACFLLHFLGLIFRAKYPVQQQRHIHIPLESFPLLSFSTQLNFFSPLICESIAAGIYKTEKLPD